MASKGPVETYVTRGWVVAGPFGEEDSEENLLFEEEPSNNLPQIRGGTLHKLIERATFDKYPDPEYVHQFLLTYRSFSSPNELLTLLKARLEQPAPSNLREAELAEYNKVERNVLLRIYNFCKIWASNFWYDFMADPELRASFLEWAHTELLAKVPAASQLEKILDRELSRAEALSRALSSELAFTNDAGEMPPKPILPPTKARALGILDFHPLEFARQLTILEFEIYCKIKPWELLGLAWAKPNASSKAPHILDMIQWTNHITAFVASEIITAKGASGKIKTISFFIKVMKHLFDLHNFSGVSAISAGFQHSAVHRLRPYWGEISRAKMTILETISARISTEHNSLALRAELKQTSLPLIPYLGMFLTDLTFMDEGNPDYITLPSGKKLINFSKKRRTSIVIRDILLYQLTPYVLTPIKVIQSYIKNAQTYDDDTLYKISEQTIPRGHNKLTLKELEAAEKTQGAGRQEQLDKEIEAIIGQATENMSFGELEQVPGYPFYDSDRPGENIVFDGELVVAGTLPKLVERLTYTKKPDPRFMEAFIFAWSSFAAPEELIQLLRYRFDVPMPVKANLDTRTKYKQLVVSPTQLRVCNTMKLWLEKCNKDFLVVPGLAAMALQLMEHIADQNPILVATSQKIIDALRQLVDGQEPAGRSNIYDLKDNSLLSAPQFAAIDSTAEYPFCVSPSEFAKDLFAYDQQTFSEMLRPVTLLDFLANESKYPKFARFISWPRLLSRWTSSIILHGTSVEQRALRVDYLLQLMQEVKSLRDYHSFVGLQLGTSHGAVLKLEATIGRVDASGLAALPECKELRVQLQNYESQIKLLKAEGNGTPVTPFLPCFVSELQSDFREPKLLSNSLINFQRARGLAQRMSELVSCQNYVFQRTPSDRLLAWAAAIEKVSLSDQQIEQKTSQLLVQEQNELKAGRTSRNDSSGVFNSALRSALLADPAFSSALLKILGDEPATGGASNQALADFRVEMANEIQRVTATCVTGPDDFEELAIQALVERFGDEPAGELCEWAYRDEKGAVYGWPERISLNILTDTSGSTWIVALQPTLNTPALSGLLRKQRFYKETTRQPSVSLFIITCQAHASVLSYIDEATAEIALIRSQFC